MASFVTSGPIRMWPPQFKPETFSMPLQAFSTQFGNPFSRIGGQTQELPGAGWLLTATFPVVFGDTEKIARAFLAQLRGAAGRFYWPANGIDFRIPAAYAAESTNLVNLAASLTVIKADSTLVTADRTTIVYETLFFSDGLSTDPTRITGTLLINSGMAPLVVGNYLSFDDADGWRHLHMMVDIEADDLTGAATLTVEPPLKFMPMASTPIHVRNPSGIFRLKDDNQGFQTRRPGNYADQAAIEAMQAPMPLKVTI